MRGGIPMKKRILAALLGFLLLTAVCAQAE